MDDLIAFVKARLDEDESAAQALDGRPWEYRDTWVWDDWHEVADIFNIPDADAAGTHIARHDPARVLREIEADRALLAAYEDAGEYSDPWIGLDFAVRLRAAVHSDHPDYRQEWAPS